MPRFISDGKTPEDLQDFLEPGEHLLVDHSAIPGVLSPAAHGTTDHTGIPGVGDLTTAAHAVLNHAGIPGVGLQGTQVLSAPQTQTSLQAALNDANTKVVFLLPGLYNLGVNGGIIIPQGKALIGLSGVPPRDNNHNYTYNTSYHAVFQLNTTLSGGNAYFFVQRFARLANIVINAVGSSGSSSISGILAEYSAIIENIIIDRWMEGVAAPSPAVAFTGGNIARNVFVRQAKGKGFSVGGSNVYMESCIAFACGNHGFELSGPCTLVNCYAYGCSGNGFRGVGSSFHKLTNCVAESNSSDGFNYTSSPASYGTLILGCTAITNGGWGFNLTAGSGGRPGAVGCCASGNMTGGFNFSGWQNFANWITT